MIKKIFFSSHLNIIYGQANRIQNLLFFNRFPRKSKQKKEGKNFLDLNTRFAKSIWILEQNIERKIHYITDKKLMRNKKKKKWENSINEFYTRNEWFFWVTSKNWRKKSKEKKSNWSLGMIMKTINQRNGLK